MTSSSGAGSGDSVQLSHYRLGRQLGEGGMGAVFEAADVRDNSRVAVKLLHPHLSTDASFRDRFEREAHVAALLRSPYTVHLRDYGTQDGTYFLVMEFIDGHTVADELQQRGPLDPDEALRIAIAIARALEEAEARGVIHRDIKPENVMLTADGAVKVADFGIARRQFTPSTTMTGNFIGTLAYASPEQLDGEVDHRSDIYALGATLYCMLAGRPPFGGNALAMLEQHRDASMPMEHLPPLPDAIVNPIRRSMEKDPVDRYASASEFAGALERARAAYARNGGRSSQRAAAPTDADESSSTVLLEPSTPPQPGSPDLQPTALEPADTTRLTSSPSTPADATVAAGAPPTSAPPSGTAPAPPATSASEDATQLITPDSEVIADEPRPATPAPGEADAPAPTAPASASGAPPPAGAAVGAPERGWPLVGRPWWIGGGIAAIVILVIIAALASDGDESPDADATGGDSLIIAGEWSYNFIIESNSCPFGPLPGGVFTLTYRLVDLDVQDELVQEGELVEITEWPSGQFVDQLVFTYPNFSWTYPATAPGATGFVTVNNTYFNQSTGRAELFESYELDSGGTCAISGTE